MKKTNLIPLLVLIPLIISLWNGCVRRPQPPSTDKSSGTKTETDVNRRIRTDSTSVYGTGYFDYRDTLESFHMGYSKPRDSVYKIENIKEFERLNLLIKSNPTIPGPYLDRGNHLQNIQKYQEAIADYNKYIQMVPDNHSGYMNRGTAHERLKSYDSALWDYDKVILLKPDDTIAFFNKGVVYDALNNPWQAIREYDSCLKRDPRLAKTYYNRGAAYEKIQDWKRAIQDFEKAVTLNPGYKAELEERIKYLENK